MLTFGPRSAFGFFQLPITQEFGYGRDVFSLAIAIQNLLWGVGQPFAGAISDRYGTVRVLCVGALLYAAGLALMTLSAAPAALHLTAGVLIGFGLSGCSFNITLAAFSKLLPPEKRSMAFGFGTAAGSFGQFLFSPLSYALIREFGWEGTALIFAAMMLLVVPLSVVLATPKMDKAPDAGAAVGPAPQSIGKALAEAFRHRSYVLLTIGFFTCGFQLAFITVHMPAYFKDIGLPSWVGAWTLALIGICNIAGSLTSGWLGPRVPRRFVLAVIYLLRSAAIIWLVTMPPSPFVALSFGVMMGFLWLSTIPPTSSLVMLMFGTRYMAMLYGFVFFSHQLGGFLGVWLGGVLYERLGSYDSLWWGSVVLGILSAAINLPIVERPVERAVAPAAA